MEEQDNKRTWINPVTKEQVTVEIDSPEDKAFVEKLNNSGLRELEKDEAPLPEEWWENHRQERLAYIKSLLDGTIERKTIKDGNNQQ